MSKKFKILRVIMISALVVILVGFGVMGQISQNQGNIATYNEKVDTLGKCPDKPNCVSSFDSTDNSHYLAPLEVTPERLALVNSFFTKDCSKQKDTHQYWYYTCKSAIFGFVDDIEILYIEDTKKLYFRSASRVGHSDLGKNKKRINELIEFLQK